MLKILRQLLSNNPSLLIIFSAITGILSGYSDHHLIIGLAQGISHIFINLLSLISIPIIFLSITATISGMESFDEMKLLGKKVLKYTISTTIIAATVALIIFKFINPVGTKITNAAPAAQGTLGKYFAFLKGIVPSNLIEALSNNSNVIAVVFLALLISLSILTLADEEKKFMHKFFSSLFSVVLKITQFILYLIPLGIWAFVTLFIKGLQHNLLGIEHLALYVLCIILANLVQGFIILPLFLVFKGISPYKTAYGMAPALSIAFLSKSSSIALPLTIKCAQENVGISKRVANFTLPLCATINMNACAAFILITVLFVAQTHGINFSTLDLVAWIIISSIAAIGNAGVPMGCYFLASAFIATLNVPLDLLGVILPIYAFIDMIETALNVWSDACVATIVDSELKR